MYPFDFAPKPYSGIKFSGGKFVWPVLPAVWCSWICYQACAIEQIYEAISTVLSGQKYVSSILRKHLLDYTILRTQQAGNPLLSMCSGELIVIDMLCEGNWNKEIAGKLRLKTSAVSTYKKRVFEKLGVQTLLQMYSTVEEMRQVETGV